MMGATTDRWQQTFDAWASQPELASTGTPVEHQEIARLGQTLADWMGLDGKQLLCDVGCASGRLTRELARRTLQTCGLDRSEALIQVARSEAPDGGQRYLTGDATALPFPDASFDVVHSYAMLLCLPDHASARRAVSEMLRVARQDCCILLGSLPDPRHKQTFFAQCEALAPWYRRAVPKPLRRALRRIMHPDQAPDHTDILWFDIEDLATSLRDRGFVVDVLVDPEYENYPSYRRSLLLRRGRAILRELPW